LLGGLLLDNRKWDEIAGAVTANDFYNHNHRLIFEAISRLQEDGTPADIVTVSEWLEKQDNLDKAGGPAYISALANNTPGVANILAYAQIVRDRAILRSLILAANDIAEAAYNPRERSPREVLNDAEQLVFEISERDGRRRREFTALQDLLTDSVGRLEDLSASPESITGVPTGFVAIDNLTAGLHPGDLIVVAGRPSMGKTTFALNIAEYVAVKKELPVAVFSMEMSGEQLSLRMLSSMGRIDSQKFRSGDLSDDDWKRVSSAIKILEKAPVFIDDSGGLNPLELSSRVRRLFLEKNVFREKESKNKGLVIIDYLQMMASDSSAQNENRATQISDITRSLKMLAKHLGVPVIALSQLNRAVEQRPDKRPMMADLRESGAIEQDADVIFFIYRDEHYNKESEHKGIAEVNIGKQRNGPTDTVQLTFLAQYSRFENYAPEHFGQPG